MNNQPPPGYPPSPMPPGGPPSIPSQSQTPSGPRGPGSPPNMPMQPPPNQPPPQIEGRKMNSDEGDSCYTTLAVCLSWVGVILFFPCMIFMCYKVVREYQRAVIFRMGRVRDGGRAQGPGSFFILPCVDDFYVLDLRTVTFDVPPQIVLTLDSVSVAVDAVVYYRVRNPTLAVVSVANYNESTQLLACSTLRNVLGTRNLSELVSERDSIAAALAQALDEATDPWGIKVERVEIKNVGLPADFQRAMASEAEAAREAKAKYLIAEGEMKASQALREASNNLNQSPGALSLRYLQTLTTIAAERKSTILFPLPMEILRPFQRS